MSWISTVSWMSWLSCNVSCKLNFDKLGKLTVL